MEARKLAKNSVVKTNVNIAKPMHHSIQNQGMTY